VFDGEMSEPRPLRAIDPNIVLRGGPLDGEKLTIGSRAPLSFEVGDERAVYRPTAEHDDEYPTLTKWVFDHTEPA
jgi:hypothetical protein